ncbi:hypothetical protein MASR1M32_43140 [Rhodobacter sp.]
MPIPAPNLYPPFNTVRLSHVELGVTDLARSRAFYVDTLGLQVTDEDADTIYLRALEERGHHCIVLKHCERAEARDLGFKVFDEDHLDRAAAFFRGAICRWTGSIARFRAGPSAPATRRAFRWNSTHGWTACRRSIRNTVSTKA